MGSGRSNTSQGILSRRTQEIEDLVELINIVFALEDRLAAEQFREDTSDGPHVDYGGEGDSVSPDFNVRGEYEGDILDSV